MTLPIIQRDREMAWKIRPAGYFLEHKKDWMAGKYDACGTIQTIARARIEGWNEAVDKAAQTCLDQQAVFGSEEYATNQPLSSFDERFACGRCAEEIRNLRFDQEGRNDE